MEHKIKRSLIAALVSGSIEVPITSHATNGMFMIGYGAKSVAMGGAAIANPQDSLASAANPAAGTAIGNRFDIGIDFFRPEAYAVLGDLYQPSVATHYENWNVFFIPHIGYSKVLSPTMTFGFTFVPAGGGGSRYEKNLFNYAENPASPNVNKPLGISLDIAQMNPTLSFKLNDKNSVGATLVLSFQKFRAIGLDYFSNFTLSGVNATNLTDNGNDYAYGAGLRLGYLGKFMNDRLLLGAVGRRSC